MSKFIPKVGDSVTFPSGFGKVAIEKEDDNGIIIVLNNLNEYVRVAKSAVKPSKTGAEIEREELKNWLNNDGYIYQMTATLLMNNICERLILGGYRKQQVNPLSESQFTIMWQDNNVYPEDLFRELRPYTIQGGE